MQSRNNAHQTLKHLAWFLKSAKAGCRCSLDYFSRLQTVSQMALASGTNKIVHSLLPLLVLLSVFLSACSTTEAIPTSRPTRIASAPTLQASPTFRIQSSGELYALETPSGSNNAASAGLPSGQYAPPIVEGTRNSDGVQVVEVVLTDGSMLAADLYETASLGRVPGLIFLGSDPLSWGALPQTLRGRDYTVLVLSLPRTDSPVSDFQSLLETMSLVGSVDPAHLAVIAELDSANWALEGCAAYELCDALALFSPTSRERTQAAITQFAPRPLLVAAAQDDAESYPVALNLAGIAQASTQFEEEVTGKGAGLLVLSDTLQNSILNWLDEQLKSN